MIFYRFAFVCASLLLVATLFGCAHGMDGPDGEFRSINTDQYEVALHRNGLVSLRTIDLQPVLKQVGPAVVLADSASPRPLLRNAKITQRAMVRDRLGDGQGLVIATEELEWYWQAYPGKPFVTVQAVYVNRGKTPVSVARLLPAMAMGPGAGVGLGGEAASVWRLENGRLFTNFDDFPEAHRGEADSQWNLALHQPGTGRSLIAGFLTNLRAHTVVSAGRGMNPTTPERLERFEAACVYDPPVTVAPGERLESEMLYLAVAEGDPLLGLERFAKAMAVWNGVRDERPFVPHGWDSWSTRLHRDIDEATLLRELDAMERQLGRFGWKHFAIDAGWERGRGDWHPDPVKFPRGLRPLVDEIHRRGMTAGLWLDPFTVALGTAVAEAHPDWLLEPSPLGRVILGNNLRVLDITRPEVYAHVRETCRRIAEDWGFDALMEADFTYHLLLCDGYADRGLTRIEVLRRGMEAVREGFGPDRFIMTMTPHPVNGVYAQGIRLGRDCAPVWRAPHRLGAWGAVETLTNSIRRFYFAPHLYVPDQDVVFFGHESSRRRWGVENAPPLTWEQSLAWLTGAALTGGVVKIGEPFSDLSSREIDALRRVLPGVGQPARPLDLFQEETPRVWHLPIAGPAGLWHVLALFNWDTEEAPPVSVPLAALGESPDRYLTVHDYWQGAYRGTVAGRLDVRVPPASVTLLGLRRLEPNPMLIASDRHITMGALDHDRLDWDPAARRLSGEFRATPDAPHTLRILVPEGFTPRGAALGDVPCDWRMEGRILLLTFDSGAGGPTRWRAEFDAAP